MVRQSNAPQPPSGSAVRRFLAAVRRRLRLVWAWSTGSLLAPVVAAIALLLVVLGRVRPWAWPEQGALLVALAALTAVVVAAVIQPLSWMSAARAADRAMDTKDIFSSVLQFEGLDNSFGQEIRRRSDHEAVDGRPTNALPLATDRRTLGRWLVAGLLGTAAVLLAVVVSNPQDDERRRLNAVAAQAEEAVEELEELAAEAEEAGNESLSEVLNELAQELGDVNSMEEATELVDGAIEELQAQRDPNFSSQEAAAEGLQRSLEAEPFPGVEAAEGATDAASQLEDLAEGLESLSDAEQAEVAEQLADLAEGQQAGDPATAEQLEAASEALAAGDVAGAQAALGEAAAAQGATADSVAGQQASDQAAEALGELLRQAEGAGQEGEAAQGDVDCPEPGEVDEIDPDAPSEAMFEGAQGDANPECVSGPGEGEGQGAGQGQGQGQGQGTGQGAGEGQGQGAGGAQGEVSGSDALDGGAAQGGVGSPDGGDQTRREGDNSGSSIVDPDALEAGDPLDLGGALSNDGSSETVGSGEGQTTSGGSRVPVSDVVGDYAERASRAADSSRLPPSQQELVGDYFDVLTQGGGG